MKPYYEADGIALYHGNCMDVLDALPARPDAFVTDPPFALTGGISNGRNSETTDQFFAFWWRALALKLAAVCGESASGFIWCDWKTASAIAAGFSGRTEQSYEAWRVSQMLYHFREMPGQGAPFRSSVDMIAYARGPLHRNPPVPATTLNLIQSYWYYGKHAHHPSEKSVKVAGMLVDWTGGKRILDPCAGSGTTLVAAKARGLDAIGIEQEETFCETAAKRLQQTALGLTPTEETDAGSAQDARGATAGEASRELWGAE